MSWNKVTKEDLKEVGLDPDEIKSALAAVKDGSATKEDLGKVNEALTALGETLKSLETKLTVVPENKTEDKTENKTEEGTVDPLDFMNDPAKHVKELVSKDMAKLQLQNIKIYSDQAYQNAKNDSETYPYFRRFETEIKKKWDEYPLQFKGQPIDLITNMYKIVVADHLEEIKTETAKGKGTFNVIQSGGGTSGGHGKTEEVKPEDSLTEEELKAAKNFNMTPKEYAEQKGQMRYV